MHTILRKVRSGLSASPFKRFAGFVPFLLMAVAGFIALRAFKLFKPSPTEKVREKDEKEALKNYSSSESSESKTLDLIASNLAKQNFKVNTLHSSIADTLHRSLDNAIIDHERVIALVRGMHIVTYKLVAVAYGLRELRNYRNAHVFSDFDTWKDLFSEKKLYGTLKYHLSVVLTDAELKKINSWLILT